MNSAEFRKSFPLAQKTVYFDNAATSLTCEPALAKMTEYYHDYRANIHRGAHRLTRRATEEYARVYDVLAKFFGAKPSEFIDVRNTTEAINAVALGIDFPSHNRSEVVVSNIEHHSNLLPWIRLEQEGKIKKLKIVNATKEGELRPEDFANVVGKQTALVAFTAVSNVLGVKEPVKEIVKIARDAGALSLVDAAQAVGHVPVDFRAWGCDFAAFSGHKCFGPTGVGALFHRENASAGVELKPVFLGGGIITKASLHDFELVANRERFEAGTPNIAGWLGLGAAFEFISKHASFMQEQERSLVKAMLPLAEKRGVHYYGSRDAARKIGIFSFNVGRLKHHEVAVMFDSLARVCVRSGHHCAMPLHRELFGVDGSVRASVHAYNTLEEVAAFQGTLDKITRLA